MQGEFALSTESFYFENDGFFAPMMESVVLALIRVETGGIIFDLWKGGDGKGMGKISDESAHGSNKCAKLDCSFFYDIAEFRRSAHFAWGLSW